MNTPPSPSTPRADSTRWTIWRPDNLHVSVVELSGSDSVVPSIFADGYSSELIYQTPLHTHAGERYSPYLPSGVPSRGKMLMDAVKQLLRVKVLGRPPVTVGSQFEELASQYSSAKKPAAGNRRLRAIKWRRKPRNRD